MPELPEVENVRVSLRQQGVEGLIYAKVELLRAGLRQPFPRNVSRLLKGQKITAIRRRAKFLLFETEKYFVISHLGMTGSWRILGSDALEKHDHVVLHFESGLRLVYNDPRRFGVFDLAVRDEFERNKWFKHLGLEPLEAQFTGEWLFKSTRKLKGPIKSFIMDQRRVVGVGNIYASEALFASGVKPRRAAGRITSVESESLAVNIRRILSEAIAAGGSTIRDYKNSSGDSGSFQMRFKVYDRAGEPCVACGTKIKSEFIAGRNTYWCPKCQR